MFVRRKVITVVIAVLLVVVAAIAWTLWRYGPSAALILDLSGTTSALRPWLRAPRHDVTHHDVRIATRHGQVDGRIYRPAGTPSRTVVVFPGIHAGDLDEPRLAAFSSRLSAAGFTVVSVPLPDLRRYHVTPASTDIIEDATAWAATRPEVTPAGQVALVGVSFAGGLAIVAAGRPSLAGKLSGVVSLGGHADLPRVMRYLSGVSPLAGEPPPHDYGTVIILLGALPYLVPPGQVEPAQRVVTMFLDASSLHSNDPDAAGPAFAAAESAALTLPSPAREIVSPMVQRDVAKMGTLVAPWIDALGGAPALSPVRSPVPRVPVFLLHGDADPVIPSTESTRLAADLRTRGTPDVRVLITPLLRHADVHDDASLTELWKLVAFWRQIMTH